MLSKSKKILARLFNQPPKIHFNTPDTAIRLEDLKVNRQSDLTYLDMPISSVRGFMELGAPMMVDAGNPFIETARVLIQHPNISDGETPLADFYRKFCPKNAAELFGINNPNETLLKLKPIATSLPWIGKSGDYLAELREHTMREQGAQYDFALTSQDGFNSYGPVSSSKLKLEVLRLRQLIYSIKTQGYFKSYSSDPITGGLLIRGDQANACLLLEGNHRVSVLAALGYERVTVLIRNQCNGYREMSKHWPGVIDNTFTSDNALDIFDRIEKGKLPIF